MTTKTTTDALESLRTFAVNHGEIQFAHLVSAAIRRVCEQLNAITKALLITPPGKP